MLPSSAPCTWSRCLVPAACVSFILALRCRPDLSCNSSRVWCDSNDCKHRLLAVRGRSIERGYVRRDQDSDVVLEARRKNKSTRDAEKEEEYLRLSDTAGLRVIAGSARAGYTLQTVIAATAQLFAAAGRIQRCGWRKSVEEELRTSGAQQSRSNPCGL